MKPCSQKYKKLQEVRFKQILRKEYSWNLAIDN